MRLWIGIHFYRLGLNVLRPLWVADMLPPAMAVLENDQVIAMTASAADLGVRAGMRRRSVQQQKNDEEGARHRPLSPTGA